MEGTIKQLNKEKRYGFIVSASNKKDYFFHASSLKNARFEDLNIGQDVEFEDSESTKGLRAEDIYV